MTNHYKRKVTKPPSDIGNSITISAMANGGFASVFRGTDCKRTNVSRSWKRLITDTDIGVSKKLTKPAFLRLVSDNDQITSVGASTHEPEPLIDQNLKCDAMSDWIRRMENSNGEAILYNCKTAVGNGGLGKTRLLVGSQSEDDNYHFVFDGNSGDVILDFEHEDDQCKPMMCIEFDSLKWSTALTSDNDDLLNVLIDIGFREHTLFDLDMLKSGWIESEDDSEVDLKQGCFGILKRAKDALFTTGSVTQVMFLLHILSQLEQQDMQASNGETTLAQKKQLQAVLCSLLHSDDFSFL